MGLFGWLSGMDINSGVEEYRATEGAMLLDVRTPAEYATGHVDGSRNIPLDNIAKVLNTVNDKATPLYIHCQSGARSASAASFLKRNGYTNVKDIGGIAGYRGKQVK